VLGEGIFNRYRSTGLLLEALGRHGMESGPSFDHSVSAVGSPEVSMWSRYAVIGATIIKLESQIYLPTSYGLIFKLERFRALSSQSWKS
jgi:hypothetical protein